MSRTAFGLVAVLLSGVAVWGQKSAEDVRTRQIVPMQDTAARMSWFMLNGIPVNPIPASSMRPPSGMVSVDALKIPEAAANEMQKFTKAFNAGKLDDSVKHISKAIKIYPQWAAAHHDLGQTYARMGDYEKAVPEFQSAAELDSQMVRPRISLSKVYFLQKKFADGEAAARQALEVDPENADARYFLARNLASEGQTSTETIELLQKSKEQFNVARLVLANIYLRRGAINTAVQELRGYTVQADAPDKEKVQCMVRKLTEPEGTVNCVMQ